MTAYNFEESEQARRQLQRWLDVHRAAVNRADRLEWQALRDALAHEENSRPWRETKIDWGILCLQQAIKTNAMVRELTAQSVFPGGQFWL